jgi:hypothetical protein
MNQKTAMILAICVSLLVGAGSTFVLIQNDESSDLFLPAGIYGLPLSKLWAIVLDETGVDNSTAVLDQVRIRTAPDGSVESLILDLYGDEGSQHRLYHVEVGSEGAIIWHSSTLDDIPVGTHPLPLLVEIEQIPFRELDNEKNGMVIQVDSQGGDLVYDVAYGDIYALHSGELIPLKRVEFHTNEPFYTIAVCSRRHSGYNDDVPETSASTPENGNPCVVVFPLQELDVAESVEYKEPGTREDAQ